MKKVIAIIIAVITIYLLYTMSKQQEQEQQQEADKIAQENAQAKQEAVTNAMKKIEISNIVMEWRNHFNWCLPVYAEHWKPLAQISHDDWHYVKEEMQNWDITYKDAYDRIEYWSNPFFKSGFYKKEFDSIRDALKQRSKW